MKNPTERFEAFLMRCLSHCQEANISWFDSVVTQQCCCISYFKLNIKMHFRFPQGPGKNNQKANAVSLIVPLSQKLSIFLIGYQLTVKISCFMHCSVLVRSKRRLAYRSESISETVSHAAFFFCQLYFYVAVTIMVTNSLDLSFLGLTVQLLMLAGVMLNVFYISDVCSDQVKRVQHIPGRGGRKLFFQLLKKSKSRSVSLASAAL